MNDLVVQHAESTAITHRPGKHCGSSAIRDILEFHGLNISEAMCFGLGSGLGIHYLKLPEGPIPFMTHVRSLGFEASVFETLGEPFRWESFGSELEAANALNAILDSGNPALLLTDIFHLPYFASSTHFPGHAIVAWRRNAASGQVFVTDTERPDPLPVASSDLTKARFSRIPPFTHDANLFAPQRIQAEGVTSSMLLYAIRKNASYLLQAKEGSGISALESWQADLPRWTDVGDWRWTARFAYQIIEKRGTGGGGFRTMYADFLDEAAAFDKQITLLKLPPLMRQSARRWSELADEFRRASEESQFPVSRIEKAISAVKMAENEYAETAITL